MSIEGLENSKVSMGCPPYATRGLDPKVKLTRWLAKEFDFSDVTLSCDYVAGVSPSMAQLDAC